MNRKILIVPILLTVILFSACISQYEQSHTLRYDGSYTDFRSDLNKARLVPVYPSESVLKELILTPDLQQINITFIDNRTENGYYAAAAFEIGNKLTRIKIANNLDYTINASIITSVEDMIPIDGMVYLFLSGPSQSNETSVLVDNSIVFLSCKEFGDPSRKYSDLDLSVGKMLITIMEDKAG
jgi:hypothetical protein